MDLFSGHINRYLILVLFSLTWLLQACEESRIYDKNESLGKSGWYYEDVKTFEVNITDTLSTYNLFINVRHTDQYPYNNIWLNVVTIFPDSTRQEGRINLAISDPDGKWTGICSDGICFNSVAVEENFHFSKTGKYTFQIRQDMRINPLPYLMHIGLRVEKFLPAG